MLIGRKCKNKKLLFFKYYNDKTQFIAVLRCFDKELNKNYGKKNIYTKKQ